MSDRPGVHRELIPPNPRGTTEERAHGPVGFTITSPHVSWLELHRRRDGTVRYYLGASIPWELNLTFAALQGSFPGLHLGPDEPCPIDPLHGTAGLLLRGIPGEPSHFWPIRRAKEDDRAGTLVRTLAAREVREHELILQVLFRRVPYWESGYFSAHYDTFLTEGAKNVDRNLVSWMHARKSEPAYHVEVRASILGPHPEYPWGALHSWLGSWTTARGTPWRSFASVKDRHRDRFFSALRDHDITGFHSPRSRRDVSGSELAAVIPIPWRDHHVEVSYAGAPTGRIPVELSARPGGSEPVIGSVSGSPVRLPPDWNHFAILGRTQTGKSSFALNLALQLLAKQPAAHVVVLEPTGTLIQALVARIDPNHAMPAVEVEPARPTFDEDSNTMVLVPVNPLVLPAGRDLGPAEMERQREVVIGGILQAFRCAWGPESIGGRAEFVIRAVLQGLLGVERSNLVDAYYLLSDKKALARFVRSLPPGPLRPFLETHLPKLDYSITISSLDKLGKIATNPLLRVALCQRAAPISFDHLLENRLLLLNLSKGALGADGANFLGAIYLSQLWGALQRVGTPDRPVVLIVDEAQNYPIPVLSEMLSEGRKFGLHVVLVTQYLDRVAEGLRTALLGNVDTWAFFPLGAEDSGPAWRIANGQRHGWTPQDFVEGLRPRQFALVRTGTLLKVDSVVLTPPSPHAQELAELVRASSRRYAQPEDSKASSWLADQDGVEGALWILARGPRTREELAAATSLPPEALDAALMYSATAGDVVRDGAGGHYHLTSRGSVHLRALQGRANEGEEHVETLTELAMFLERRGIVLSIPRQVAGVLMPDAQFRYADTVYNVEVECSTIAKAAEQIVRNVRKAREVGNRVLIALPDSTGVQRVLAVLDRAFPGLRLWADGVGVVWRGEDSMFHPHRDHGTQVWRFLEGESTSGFETPEVDDGAVAKTPADQVVDTDPLVRQARSIVRDLIDAQKTEATIDELRDRLPVDARDGVTDQRLGMVLAMLGLPCRRVKERGVRFRVYNLVGTMLHEGPDEVREGDPTAGPDAIRRRPEPDSESGSRAPDFSSEGPTRDLTTRRGPSD